MLKYLSIILILAGAAQADSIPPNARVCTVSNHYNFNTFLYSCDGKDPAELDPVVPNLAITLNGDMTQLSGQLLKFIDSGYTLKASNNDIYVFIK